MEEHDAEKKGNPTSHNASTVTKEREKLPFHCLCSISAKPLKLRSKTSFHSPNTCRLIGDSKLPVGVNVRLYGCWALHFSPVMNQRPTEVEPHLHLCQLGWLKPCHHLAKGKRLQIKEGWMDGWMDA